MAFRAHLIVSGSVQGVNFRWFAQEKAKECGVKGWVKNMPDDTVEIMCEAETEKAYRDFLNKLEKKYSGPGLVNAIDVKNIQVVSFEKDVDPEFTYFNIEY